MEIIAERKVPENWDKMLLGTPTGNFFQSTFQAEYMKKDVGYKPIYFKAVDNGETIIMLQAFEHSKYDAGLFARPFFPITRILAGLLFPVVSSVYAPVILNDSKAPAAFSELLKFLKTYKKPVSISCHPFFSPPDTEGFRKKDWGTFIVDLSQPLEKLWQNLDRSARTRVTKSQSQVQIKEVETKEEYRNYFNLLNECRKTAGIHPYRYSETSWESYRASGHGRIFIAVKDGAIMAGMAITSFNGYINESGVCTSPAAREHGIFAQDALKWHVIKWGKENGCRYYDLSGADPSPAPGSKEEGIHMYKKKWGGAFYKQVTISTA